MGRRWVFVLAGLLGQAAAAGEPFFSVPPAGTAEGFLTRLLINEAAFPGEPRFVSDADTRQAMQQILWVLHGRIHHIPPGYTQQQVALVRSTNILDIITGNGDRLICAGFSRDRAGRLVVAPRVEERLAYLTRIANAGRGPGRFASLLNHAKHLAQQYLKTGLAAEDHYAHIRRIASHPVTGRAYAWMKDGDGHQPGGRFVRIPDSMRGSLAGNRFFALRSRNE